MTAGDQAYPACGYTPVQRCQIRGCNETVEYDGWFRVVDPVFGKPTGLLQRLLACEDHAKQAIGYKG